MITLDDQVGSLSDVTVTIDGVDCAVQSYVSSQITCTLGERTGLPDHSIEILIDGYGLASLGGNDFLYVNLWSEEATWGYELEPIEGESVYIPAGLNLLVDVDSTPVLNLVLIEGSLIFPSDSDASHERTFDAYIIYINGGKFQAGTEDEPYSSKLTITLHGEKYGPLIPIFGNKCIANYAGTLDMHGIERNYVFAHLAETVDPSNGTPNDNTDDLTITSIKVEEAVDWAVGEEIAIVPTSYVYNEDEKRTITKIEDSGSGKKIYFSEPLRYKHFSETETYDSFEVPMKGEVLLLTRNVKFMGEKTESLQTEHGAHIVSHCEGDDCLTTRISYTELVYCG